MSKSCVRGLLLIIACLFLSSVSPLTGVESQPGAIMLLAHRVGRAALHDLSKTKDADANDDKMKARRQNQAGDMTTNDGSWRSRTDWKREEDIEERNSSTHVSSEADSKRNEQTDRKSGSTHISRIDIERRSGTRSLPGKRRDNREKGRSQSRGRTRLSHTLSSKALDDDRRQSQRGDSTRHHDEKSLESDRIHYKKKQLHARNDEIRSREHSHNDKKLSTAVDDNMVKLSVRDDEKSHTLLDNGSVPGKKDNKKFSPDYENDNKRLLHNGGGDKSKKSSHDGGVDSDGDRSVNRTRENPVDEGRGRGRGRFIHRIVVKNQLSCPTCLPSLGHPSYYYY